jgi:tetratricopeptide (TPR) repeat protein
LSIAISEEKNPAAIFNMGVIYDDIGNIQKAKECYIEVLKLEPSHV